METKQRQENALKEEVLVLLANLDVDTNHITFDADGNLHIPITKSIETVPELPNGYQYSGGTARALLAKNLGLYVEPIRDLDIIRIASIEPDDALDHEIAQEHMPDDYQHGHGVTVYQDGLGHLETNDFTISELYANNKEIIATPACVRDSIKNVLDFSEYTKQEYQNDKLLAKAIRLLAKSQVLGGAPKHFSDDLKKRVDQAGIRYFHIALHLNKAFEEDPKIADAYVRKLKKLRDLPHSIRSAEEAIHFLTDYTHFKYHEGIQPIHRNIPAIPTQEELEHDAIYARLEPKNQTRGTRTQNSDAHQETADAKAHAKKLAKENRAHQNIRQEKRRPSNHYLNNILADGPKQSNIAEKNRGQNWRSKAPSKDTDSAAPSL